MAISSARSIVPLEGMVEPYVLDLVETWDKVLILTLRSLSAERVQKPIVLAVKSLNLCSPALDIAISVAASMGAQLVVTTYEKSERGVLEYVDGLSLSYNMDIEISRLEAELGSKAVKRFLCISTSSSMIVVDKKLLEKQEGMFKRRRFCENTADLLSYSAAPVV